MKAVLCRRNRFDGSLPPWLNNHHGPASFIHVDFDLHSSTRVGFTLLADRAGTAILFDEYFNYPNLERHEY
jgi:hypothetical protein